MKTNTKTKKAVAPKSKAVVKSSKPVAKTVAKKSVVKSVGKKVSTPVKAKAKPVAKSLPAKKIAAKSVKSVPKSNKIAVKKVKPLVQAKKAPAKAAKPAVKLAVKPTAKPIVAVKNITKLVKPTTKKASAPEIKPIIIKTPENQNTAVRASVIATTRPTQMAVNKMSSHTAAANAAQSIRPAYRPIQVINKPLAPIQPVRQMAPIAKDSEKVEFKKGDFVVYPAHGVGEIEAVETQTIGGMEIKLYAIAFEKDRMRLKVPVFKAHASGLRRLSNANRMDDALKTLQGRAQIRRAMWSRRAQEYETKINSGDPVSIAEVLRDLKRSNDESEQSYSERQIYQSALERLAREVAAVEKITEVEAAERLENMIKSKRARAATANAAEELAKEAANA
jgi:CarD family transcriptional regulator